MKKIAIAMMGLMVAAWAAQGALVTEFLFEDANNPFTDTSVANTGSDGTALTEYSGGGAPDTMSVTTGPGTSGKALLQTDPCPAGHKSGGSGLWGDAYGSTSPDITGMAMVRLDSAAQDDYAPFLKVGALELRANVDGNVYFTGDSGAKSYLHDVGVGNWVHVALSYDHGASTSSGRSVVKCYVDGTLVKTEGFAYERDYTATTRVEILAGDHATFGGYGLVNGAVDSVKVFDTVLSDSEIADEAAAALIPEPATFGLLGLAGAAMLLRRRRG